MASNDYQKWYRRTPKGKAINMWSDISKRAGNKDGKHPTYKEITIEVDKDSFIRWATVQLEQWIKTNPIELASIDRINNFLPYALCNLQIINRYENAGKRSHTVNKLAPFGKAWCSKCKDYLDKELFYHSTNAYNGCTSECKDCTRTRNIGRKR